MDVYLKATGQSWDRFINASCLECGLYQVPLEINQWLAFTPLVGFSKRDVSSLSVALRHGDSSFFREYRESVVYLNDVGHLTFEEIAEAIQSFLQTLKITPIYPKDTTDEN